MTCMHVRYKEKKLVQYTVFLEKRRKMRRSDRLVNLCECTPTQRQDDTIHCKYGGIDDRCVVTTPRPKIIWHEIRGRSSYKNAQEKPKRDDVIPSIVKAI